MTKNIVSAERTAAITAWYDAWRQGTFAVYFDGDLNALIARKCGCDVQEVRDVLMPIQKHASRNIRLRADKCRCV